MLKKIVTGTKKTDFRLIFHGTRTITPKKRSLPLKLHPVYTIIYIHSDNELF